MPFRATAVFAIFLQEYPRVFSQLVNNPWCFLLYEDEERAPSDWVDVSIRIVTLNVSVYFGNLIILFLVHNNYACNNKANIALSSLDIVQFMAEPKRYV